MNRSFSSTSLYRACARAPARAFVASSAGRFGPVALAAFVACIFVSGTGCGGSSGQSSSPNAASPERQAESEYDLGRDALYKGHLREALDHAQHAVALDDSNAKALYFTSVVYLGFCDAQGMKSPDCRLGDAEEFARRAMSADEHFRDARNTLGQILILEKKYADAMKVLEPLTKDPAYASSSLAWGNYGWAQVLSGKVDDGINSLRNAVTDPHFCTGHFRLGMAFEKKSDLVAAERSFSDAVQVQSPDCQSLQDAWYERGRVRQKMGNHDGAAADFARCRDISTDTETGKECARLAGGATAIPLPAIPAPAPSPQSARTPIVRPGLRPGRGSAVLAFALSREAAETAERCTP